MRTIVFEAKSDLIDQPAKKRLAARSSSNAPDPSASAILLRRASLIGGPLFHRASALLLAEMASQRFFVLFFNANSFHFLFGQLQKQQLMLLVITSSALVNTLQYQACFDL